MHKAFWFYNWAQQWILDKKGPLIAYGTPVIIYDVYDFEAPKAIWKQLVQYPDTLYQNEGFLYKIVSPYLETIFTIQFSRDSLEL